MMRRRPRSTLFPYTALCRSYDWPFEVLAEDVVWDMGHFDLPDVRGTYRGHEGVRQYWTAWLRAWESLSFEIKAIEDRKSTRLNSSHANIVCRLLLEKKKDPK